MVKSEGVWNELSKQWQDKSGQPLHPGPEDRKFMEHAIDKWAPKHEDLKALILGVTPQMARLNWPDGTDLLAVDYSQKMIDKVWPGYPNPGEGALCANWTDLPLKNDSRDVVVSDAPFGVLPYPDVYQKLLHSVQKVLKTDGIFAFRIFIQPDQTENPEEIFSEARLGKIGNFHAFKLRLLMSMQTNTETGVCIGDVWDYWAKKKVNHQKLVKETGWPMSHIKTMKAYKNQADVYYFPTLQEIRDLMADENFKELNCSWPIYELGERCPTFVYKPEPIDL